MTSVHHPALGAQLSSQHLPYEARVGSTSGQSPHFLGPVAGVRHSWRHRLVGFANGGGKWRLGELKTQGWSQRASIQCEAPSKAKVAAVLGVQVPCES
jgi:hypothetical protein